MRQGARQLVRAICEFNPNASQASIAEALGLSRQRVHQIIHEPRPPQHRPVPNYADSYESEVSYVRRVIPERGRIWEGCRPAFEAGEYYDEHLARMLREGVLVPANDPDGGYVLPEMQSEPDQ